MKKIFCQEIIENIRDMCIEANYTISEDVRNAIVKSSDDEESDLGKLILKQLSDNIEIAKTDMVPICQDTGMAVVHIDIGQEVIIEGGYLEEAINEGVRQGYSQGYLRKSVVKDPIIRTNTNDNTPAIIHYQIVKGDCLKITVAPKGFGSENKSKIYMLSPSDGVEGIKKVVIQTVDEAGPSACPPMIVGVGIGGSFEKCAILAKKALLRNINEESKLEHIAKLEKELLFEINNLGIGPQGLGGSTTALGVNIDTYPTHIASIPVAVNICCHVNRHVTRIL
jgi:fumarate hydratase subunit alpha